jgi:hypothetical protein
MRGGHGDPKFGVPDYHPYQASGDFNGDGKIDFAVTLADRATPASRAIVVFNAPFTEKPAFFKQGVTKDESALFFFAEPRPKPWRLGYGAFQSEGTTLVPTGNTYREE